MTDAHAELAQLAQRLEDAAARLRGGELDADAGAALVDDCARLAAQAAAELDRAARTDQAVPGQDALL